MAETRRTEAEMLALLVVDGLREIGAQDLRDIVYSVLRPDMLDLQDQASAPSHLPGRMWWGDGTLNVMRDVSGVVANLPEEVQLPVALNNTGAQIDNGAAVYISGATGNKPTIALATNTDSTAEMTIAVATHDIADGAYGHGTTFGMVRDLDTSAWAEGTELFLGIDGALTETKPSYPSRVISIGYVTYQHPNNGEILVSIRRVRIDTAEYGALYFSSAAATDCTQNVWIKAAGTTTFGPANDFDSPVDNRLRHTDAETETYDVRFSGSMTCVGVNQVVYIGISKNGQTPEQATWRPRTIGTGTDYGAVETHWLIELAQNDYVETWVMNETSDNDVTIEYGSFTCHKL